MQTSNIINMKKAFTIFKEGMTEKPVQIIYDPKLPYNINAKADFYKSLGYTVTMVKQK